MVGFCNECDEQLGYVKTKYILTVENAEPIF
jgi:hypothetical protein